MTTTATTGYWITKCDQGHVARYTDTERDSVLAPRGSTKYGYTICHCNGTAPFKPIMARAGVKDCDARCTSAIGPACDCKCRGENHGSDH